jgi:glycosyltransferase involved in cell wall biosynthesis
MTGGPAPGSPTPSRLRVALDATPLLGARTGIGAFTAGLLDQLARRPGLDVTTYGLTWRGRRELADATPTGTGPVHRPMAARPLRLAWQRWDRPPVEWWTGPVDVVHGTNFVVPPTAAAASVVTVHDLTPVHYPELCDAATLAFPALVRRAIARGAWVHAHSRFVADEIVRHLGAPAERVVTIPAGVPALAPADPAVGHRLAGTERYVLAMGTVEPRKGLPLLVRAFDAVAGPRAGVRLVIAGPDGWGAEALRQAVAEAHHGDRVVRLGWVDDASRAALLRGATVVAYPSRYEGFGFPPLEAMAAGVPVVATTAGSLPEVLGDAAALVPVGDAAALTEALATLLDDPGRRGVLVAAGRQRVSAYRWEHTAGAMESLYRQAASDRS